mgnify:CR=1 FL=1
MKKVITLSDIAGYATERMVWQLMFDLSTVCDSDHVDINNMVPQCVAVDDNHFQLRNTDATSNSERRAFSAPETFAKNSGPTDTSVVWTIGALAFYAITGTDVFEGKGGETQTQETEIPRLSSAHASKILSTLIHRCLSYHSADRPTKEEIRKEARAGLSLPVEPRKRLSGQTGKSYGSSLVKFWPEEMVPTIIACIFLLLPTGIFAQSSKFGKTDVPNEMASLVLRCIDLRSPQNIGKISKLMDRDMSWTMMDELALDKNGECTTKDMVDMFGLNDIGFSIIKRHGGVTNAGGRFRDGRDPRYKYSFIEIPVKKDKTVNYKITGREGKQLFAIVPFEKDARFAASIPNGISFTDKGVCYIWLEQGVKKTDAFMLTLKNLSGKNMAFAIISYNSRIYE